MYSQVDIKLALKVTLLQNKDNKWTSSPYSMLKSLTFLNSLDISRHLPSSASLFASTIYHYLLIAPLSSWIRLLYLCWTVKESPVRLNQHTKQKKPHKWLWNYTFTQNFEASNSQVISFICCSTPTLPINVNLNSHLIYLDIIQLNNLVMEVFLPNNSYR
jgi:hypothetical protein